MSNHPAIDKIPACLERFPEIPVIQKDNSISINAKNQSGFTAQIVDNSTDFFVSFDGWHTEDFKNYDDAANLFLCGLTSSAKLYVNEKWGFPYMFFLELQPDYWKGANVTGCLFFPLFFGKKKEYCLINDWIDYEQLKPLITE